NIKAAVELCEIIAPKVLSTLPRARIVVAGRNPTVAIRKACLGSGVELIANPADISPLLRASRLALAPIDWTPGANLKVLEALAAGTRVLAYSAAVSQLPEDVEGVRSCDRPTEMARVAVDVLGGNQSIEPPRRNRHIWPARAIEFERVLNQVLGLP